MQIPSGTKKVPTHGFQHRDILIYSDVREVCVKISAGIVPARRFTLKSLERKNKESQHNPESSESSLHLQEYQFRGEGRNLGGNGPTESHATQVPEQVK